MTKVVILGHGEYGSMIKSNLGMLIGEIKGFYFLDFKPNENLEILKNNIKELISEFKDEPILFACDLTGGSPFREACLLASENKNYVVVGGLNTTGYAEMAFNLKMNPEELANLGVEASKASMVVFKQE